MRYRALESFLIDFGRLPPERRVLFLDVLRIFVLPAIAAGSMAGGAPWPERIPVRRLANSAIYSLTWHISQPDGKATFHQGVADDGEPVLVWRRIGDHGILAHPLAAARSQKSAQWNNQRYRANWRWLVTQARLQRLVAALTAIVGADHVVTDPLDLRTYECDGLTSHRSVPAVVVLPGTAGQTAAIVRACSAAQVPFVARGSGTGLSGGALPHKDGVLIVMSRMRSIIEVDPASRRAVVEPGVTNLAVSKAVAPHGLFYAPDPSSQVVCSVGGNVAENSGGAHCLKHGFTVHHVTGLEIVTPDGELTWLGDGSGVAGGYDLLGAFTGSEGTLGIATKIVVKLTPLPETVHTLLAAYPSTADGGRAVSDIIAAGIVPGAIEIMDALSIEAAEAAVHCGYPPGAGAVLIVELDGPAAEVATELTLVREICERAGATEIRAADDPAQRAAIWAGRKSAFAAVGRISSSYIVQDGVVPRTALGAVLARIAGLSQEAGIRVANVFHAGDGNLHPLVLYNEKSAAETQAAEELSGAILDACIEYGGSITGEHGVGVDKSRYMPKMFTETDLDTMQLVRCAFDPRNLCNPGKVFPTPRLCGEIPGARRASAAAAGQADLF